LLHHQQKQTHADKLQSAGHGTTELRLGEGDTVDTFSNFQPLLLYFKSKQAQKFATQ